MSASLSASTDAALGTSPPPPIESVRTLLAARGSIEAGRLHAIARLSSLEPSLAPRALAALAGDIEEAPRVRHLAVELVARLDQTEARETLTALIGDPDRDLGGRAALALVRVGSVEALDALAEVGRSPDQVLASRARFAAAVIAHRFNVAGHDLPSPADSPLLTASDLAEPAQVVGAPLALVRRAAAEVAMIAPAFRFDGPGVRVDCAQQRNVLLLAAPLAADPALLEARRWHAAQLAFQNPSNGRFSPGLIVLTTPRGPAVDIGLYRGNGPLVYGGRGRVVAGSFTAEVRTVRRPGAAAIKADIVVEDGSIALTVRSDVEPVIPPRQPSPAG